MRAQLWAIIVVGMLLTYATRLSFIALIPYERMPVHIRRGLRFVPPAVLAALILPALLQPAGALNISLGNQRLLAGLVAALVAWRFKNTWLTIACGMLSLWLLNSL
jgi:branched-subunit amino acid transport protein